ncbi:MAG: sulfurtransferase complex subunit TusD [Pseudomonadota bacterium]
MAIFAVFITKAPYESNNAYSALTFCREALSSGHKIQQVFFYAEGTQIASTLSSFDSSETDIKSLWVAFKEQHNIPLNVCATAGIRRGMASKEDNMGHDNYDAHFEPVGMLQYFQALRASDIISVQF